MFIIFTKASIFQTFRLHFKLFKSGVVDIFNLCICSTSKLHCHSGNSPLYEFCWQAETTFQYRSSMFFSKQYLALQPNFMKKKETALTPWPTSLVLWPYQRHCELPQILLIDSLLTKSRIYWFCVCFFFGVVVF